MKTENRGLYWVCLELKFRLQNVQKMAFIALQTGENTNLT